MLNCSIVTRKCAKLQASHSKSLKLVYKSEKTIFYNKSHWQRHQQRPNAKRFKFESLNSS